MLTINAGGLVTSNGNYNTLPVLVLNGGQLLANGGASAAYPAYQLRSVTVGGGATSSITAPVGSFSAVALGQNAGDVATFNVAATGDPSGIDLLVSAPLQNGANGNTGLTKSGNGLMQLQRRRNLFRSHAGHGRDPQFAAGSSLASAGNLNATGGGVLAIGGTVTMATATTFGVGSGITGTTGTVVVKPPGGALNIGVGAGNTFIGGDYINAAGTGRIGQQGTGVLDINGGILTVAREAPAARVAPAASTTRPSGSILTVARAARSISTAAP